VGEKDCNRASRGGRQRVTDNASFGNDLPAESLDKIDLVMGFENEFGSEIRDAAASAILSIGDAVRFIEAQAA
jgi:acyl carrier protein